MSTTTKKFDSRTMVFAVLVFFLIYFVGLVPGFEYSADNFITYIAVLAAYFIPGLILGRRLQNSIFLHTALLCLIMIATTLVAPWMVSGFEAMSSPELKSKDEVVDSVSILSAWRVLSYDLSIACLVLCLLGTAGVSPNRSQLRCLHFYLAR